MLSRTALTVLVLLLLGETTINYIDRQVLSVLAPTLRAEFSLSNGQYAAVVNAFLAVYAVAYAASGWALDRLGVGKGLTLSVTWWSIANTLTGLSGGVLSLAFFRGLLAVGEAGAWPAFAKAVAMWVPKNARALAMGVCNSGSSIGSVIAPPVVAWVALKYGWRSAFVFTGLLGLVWVAGFVWFRTANPEMEESHTAREKVSWRALLGYRQTWAVFFCRFFADPLWYFFVFWIPEFLSKQRGLDLAAIGAVAWIPFLVSGCANLGSGYLALRLERAGWSVNRTRKTFMVVATILTPVGVLAVHATSLFWTIALISGAVFFWTFWSVAVHTLSCDYFPPKAVGSVYGIAGCGSTLGSAISTWAVGQVLDATHNYLIVFVGLSALMPVAMVVGFGLMGRVEPVEVSGSPRR